MILALIGASCSGKTAIRDELVKEHGFEEIVAYTTRSRRPGEIDGKDYHFIDLGTFENMCQAGQFAEYEEYSQARFYGTRLNDLERAAKSKKNYVMVVTPNGLRNIKQKINNEQLISILIEADLGIRVKRYVDRCGAEAFNFDDMNEINARVNRDFGMFLGIENEVDYCLQNNYGGIQKIVSNIFKKFPQLAEKSSDEIDIDIEELKQSYYLLAQLTSVDFLKEIYHDAETMHLEQIKEFGITDKKEKEHSIIQQILIDIIHELEDKEKLIDAVYGLEDEPEDERDFA